MILVLTEPDIVRDNEERNEDCTKIIHDKIICDEISSEDTAWMAEILNGNENEENYKLKPNWKNSILKYSNVPKLFSEELLQTIIGFILRKFPAELFEMMMTEEMIEKIVEESSKYFGQKKNTTFYWKMKSSNNFSASFSTVDVIFYLVKRYAGRMPRILEQP